MLLKKSNEHISGGVRPPDLYGDSMDNIKPNDIIDYFGVHFLVIDVTDTHYECISGFDFKIKMLDKNIKAGLCKYTDAEERVSQDDVYV